MMATCHDEPVSSEDTISESKLQRSAKPDDSGHNRETLLSLSPLSSKARRTFNDSFQSSETSNLTESQPSLNESFESPESISPSVCHSISLNEPLQSSGSLRVSMAGMIETFAIELTDDRIVDEDIGSDSSPSTAVTENTETSTQDKSTSTFSSGEAYALQRNKERVTLGTRKSILKSGKNGRCERRVSFQEDPAIIQARAKRKRKSQAKVDPHVGTASLTLLLAREKNTWDLESGKVDTAKKVEPKKSNTTTKIIEKDPISPEKVELADSNPAKITETGTATKITETDIVAKIVGGPDTATPQTATPLCLSIVKRKRGYQSDNQNIEDSTNMNKGKTKLERVREWYHRNELIILLILATILARLYPPLGEDYLFPQITTLWIIIPFMFFLAGAGIRMQTVGRSIRRPIFHTSVQVFNFFADSAIAYGIIIRLIDLDLISNALAGGIVCCACTPMTIRSVTMLSREAGGDSGAAMVSSALGNFLSVFLSPALMLVYLGMRSYNIADVTLRLSLRVITPFLVGQALQLTFYWVQELMNNRKDLVVKSQRYAIVYIVYTTFCQTFAQDDMDSSLVGMSTMIGCQVALFVTLLVLSWTTFQLAFSKDSSLRIVAVFACTQKSLPLGVALICATFGDYNNTGFLLLPLLIWYPIQLFAGFLLTSRLKSFAQTDDEQSDDDDMGSSEGTEKLEIREMR